LPEKTSEPNVKIIIYDRTHALVGAEPLTPSARMLRRLDALLSSASSRSCKAQDPGAIAAECQDWTFNHPAPSSLNFACTQPPLASACRYRPGYVQSGNEDSVGRRQTHLIVRLILVVTILTEVVVLFIIFVVKVTFL
jgi:hypothetical protein